MICKFSSERQGKMEVQVFQIYLKKSELLFFVWRSKLCKKDNCQWHGVQNSAYIFLYERRPVGEPLVSL